jgi:hypothetical protein
VKERHASVLIQGYWAISCTLFCAAMGCRARQETGATLGIVPLHPTALGERNFARIIVDVLGGTVAQEDELYCDRDCLTGE